MAEAAALARENFRAYQAALRTMPKFSSAGTIPFRQFEIQWTTWAVTMNLEQLANLDQQKMALLSSLEGPASQAIELHGQGKPGYVSAGSLSAFMTTIRQVFCPRSESNMSRMEFESYSQGVDQNITEYATTKLALYHAAEPDHTHRSFAYLRSNMLRGIYSGWIKGEVIRMDPQDEAQLIETMTTALGRARESYHIGAGMVPNLDGLASSYKTTMSTGGNNNQPWQGEPMEIGKFGDKKCYQCNKLGHYARDCRVKLGNNQPVQDKINRGPGQNNQKKDTKDLQCFYCNKKGHLRADCYKRKRDESNRNKKSDRKGVRKTQDNEEDDTPSEGEDWDDTVETLWDTPEDFRKKVAVRNPRASHL